MPQENLIRMAEQCSVLRREIGRALLAKAGTDERDDAENRYRAALRALLRTVREEECALFLEAAGELGAAAR